MDCSTSIIQDGNNFILGISTEGTPDGNERLIISPALNSIYDYVGNITDTLQTINSISLVDKTSPEIELSVFNTRGVEKQTGIITNDSILTVVFNLSENTNNFDSSDVTISGGILGTLYGSGSHFYCTFSQIWTANM